MKITRKSVALVELTLWVGILAWMVFYFLLASVMAWISYYKLPWEIWVGASFGNILRWAAPLFVVLTSLLTVCFMARFVWKQIGSKGTEYRRIGDSE